MSLGCDSNTKYIQYKMNYSDIRNTKKKIVSFVLTLVKSD